MLSKKYDFKVEQCRLLIKTLSFKQFELFINVNFISITIIFFNKDFTLYIFSINFDKYILHFFNKLYIICQYLK